ncbi:MAG: SufE family protein [Marinilabiliaceae bacterium]|nr:SufE family protein [Bacteroidales bacterium]MDD5815945.1 SufE family protein [Bacteroidales bacterium]MDY4520727.1 SufE family protein [Bacteroidales bacterium]
MTINEAQDEIVEEFSAYDDWMDKYSLLIELGNDMEAYPEEHRKDEYIIEGCQSTVWIYAERNADGTLSFKGDSDAIIVKGIVALLLKVVNGQRPQDIEKAELYFIDKIGLKENLTPTRSNGLLAMIKQIRLYAMAYAAKESANQ